MPCNTGQRREQKTLFLCGICKPMQRSATTDRTLVMSRSTSRVRLWIYCNRTATRLEQKWTEQESGGAEDPKNPLDKRFFRHSRIQQETPDLTYKEGVAGSNPASPT